VVSVTCGAKLVSLAPAAVEPLWAQGYDHQNLEACPEYLPRLKAFLAELFPEEFTSSSSGGGGTNRNNSSSSSSRR
jgi:hypothetical protein